jgi:hypothetical protein
MGSSLSQELSTKIDEFDREVNNEINHISNEAKDFKKEVIKDIDTFGEYLLLGGTVVLLVGVPLTNYLAGKIPGAVDYALTEGSKVANIVKPI